MADNDFEEADVESGVVSPPVVMPPAVRQTTAPALPVNVIEYRNRLIQEYHKGADSIIERLRKTDKDGELESLAILLLEEIVKETDHLLGNELVSAYNGDLRDSSIISFKRAEVLEKAIKTIQARMELDRVRGIDVDSPAMNTIFRFFMLKAKQTFDRMNVGTEISDLFFSTYGEVTENWKKELRDNYEELRLQQKRETG
jgi:hypothetical protein